MVVTKYFLLLYSIFTVALCKELRCLPGGSCVAATNGSIIIVGPEYGGLFQIDFPQLGDSDMILLEFLNASVLAPPSLTFDNSTGECTREYISFMGSPTPTEPFRICGDLTGQHVYLSYGIFPTIYMSMVKEYNSGIVMRLTYFSRKYRPVPSGCLQYYTDHQAEIRSFGYPIQLNNLRYTICFEDRQARTLTVSDCQNNPSGAGTFSITGIRNENNPQDPDYVGPYRPLLDCYGDWIQLFGQNKYCNQTLPAHGLTSTTKPFQIAVNFDASEKRSLGVPKDANGECTSMPLGICFDCSAPDPWDNAKCKCVEQPPSEPPIPGASELECRQLAALNRVDRYNAGFCLRATLSY